MGLGERFNPRIEIMIICNKCHSELDRLDYHNYDNKFDLLCDINEILENHDCEGIL